MKILFYSTKEFEKSWLAEANKDHHTINFINEPLGIRSVNLAKGYECISVFTADDVSAPVIRQLSSLGIKMIAIRAAGFDNVDIEEAAGCGITVANVPDYSPYAIAEHAVALMLALNRRIVKANEKVQVQNFLLDDLIGFDLNQKTVGIIGTGKIGSVMAKIMHGFGCHILAYDVVKNQKLIQYCHYHFSEH